MFVTFQIAIIKKFWCLNIILDYYRFILKTGSLIQDCFWSPQFVKFIARVNWKGFFRPCKCYLIVNSTFKLVMKDTLAQAVLMYVHLTASVVSVNTRTDRVLPVLKDGWVVIVQQVILHKKYFSHFTFSTAWS